MVRTVLRAATLQKNGTESQLPQVEVGLYKNQLKNKSV